MTGISSKSYIDNWSKGLIDADQTTVYKNFTPPGSYHTLYFEQDVSSDEELDQQKLDVMPGFELSWWYTGAAEMTPDNHYKYHEHNKLFIK